MLPVKIDGEVVNHKAQLKNYRLMVNGNAHKTLYTIYQFQIREKDGRDFAEYVDAYCQHFGIKNPYVIQPLNQKSKGWQDLVNEMMTEEDAEAVIRNVINVAVSDSRNAMKAAELLAQWRGASKKVEVDASVDANVEVDMKEPLFKLTDES